ncbi:hypothetical protein EUGRSUZ_H02346 [Eucalyptus grandis]|uniref:Uncharacterized protein n=2 Tax=Eucalyptus grandis TaxID=71139 RepID=A0ACC3JSJ0_EUCGR|nr:hypothetical protein EUGRSUZ_H02346 [Eucalyptus grandis]
MVLISACYFFFQLAKSVSASPNSTRVISSLTGIFCAEYNFDIKSILESKLEKGIKKKRKKKRAALK